MATTADILTRYNLHYKITSQNQLTGCGWAPVFTFKKHEG